MAYFPMMIDIEGRKALVVGDGREGAFKINTLKQFGARVTLVDPCACREASQAADIYLSCEFESGMIREGGYSLVVAASGDRELNKRVSEEAKREHIPVNVVDDTELCTFIFPAIVKDRDVVCAVSSGGKSPFVAQHVKAVIKDNLPENIGEINDRMGEYRIQAKAEFTESAARREFLRKKFDEFIKFFYNRV